MKKILSIILAFTVLFAATTPVSASDITTEGDHGVPVTLTVEVPRFRVTVPTVLPITQTEYGDILVADDITISNDSAGPVRVSNVDIRGINGWVTINYAGFDVGKTMLGIKNVGLAVAVSGSSITTVGPDISDYFTPVVLTTGETIPLIYNAVLPGQHNPQSNAAIAEVVFTVGWSD